ncbi:hypothetical protein PMG11_05680 [Penicillium brasilianum]|uniref:Fungal N-terminal domain-containing protein n=1 Tax=Penicillium brasilianum TaxID=104259 RepID=A0A0F7TK83_PENBI|nr:hypothetical protein PMG11_05680 [Penicillium brasilianum]
MSFGFSVGDIILCSQIAYRLFSSVTDGRKKAARDLKELEDTLFGLYCALNHLQRDHEAILAKASAKSKENLGQVHVQLGYMIKSCLETLEELDNATGQYREAAPEIARPVIGNQLSIAGLPSSRPAKTSLKIQWKRVLWDLRGDSLSKYRTKLQTHTDSINLLLSTFIWSATNRIEKDNTHQSEKLDQMLQEASRLNNNAFQIFQALYANVTTPQLQPPFGSQGPKHDGGPKVQEKLALPGPIQVPVGAPGSEKSVYGSMQLPNPTPRILTVLPFRPAAASHKAKVSVSERTIGHSGQYLKLPENIQSINESRRVVGEKQLEERKRQLAFVSLHRQLPVPQTSPPKSGTAAVDRLNRQIEDIFQTLTVPEIDRMTTNKDLQTDIVAWVSGLGDMSEQLHLSPPVFEFDKQARSTMIRELSELLITLNRLIEDSQGGVRGVFYDASGTRIDHVFAQVRSLSTFCEKEIEEFEDERKDWNENH